MNRFHHIKSLTLKSLNSTAVHDTPVPWMHLHDISTCSNDKHFCVCFIRWRVRWAWWQAAVRERRGDHTRTSCEKRRSSMLRFASPQRSVPRWEDRNLTSSVLCYVDTTFSVFIQYYTEVCCLVFQKKKKKGIGWVCSERRVSQEEKEASWWLSLQRWVRGWALVKKITLIVIKQ